MSSNLIIACVILLPYMTKLLKMSEDVAFFDTSVDDSSDRIDSRQCLQSVETHTVSLIASQLYCIIPTIVVQSFNDMACSLRSVAQSEISSSLLHVGIDKVVADDVVAEVIGKTEHCCKPLDSLSSRVSSFLTAHQQVKGYFVPSRLLWK